MTGIIETLNDLWFRAAPWMVLGTALTTVLTVCFPVW
jgi:hypothetical protein